MPNLPVPSVSYVTVQDNTTGAVDYLKYQGNKLVGSDTHDYGIGSTFKVVANEDINDDGIPDLVTQNAAGQVDFVLLDQDGNVKGTLLAPQSVPRIFGSGYFGAIFDNGGLIYPNLMSQLPDGSIDALFFNSQGQLAISDLVPNTAGTPHAVGTAEGYSSESAYAGSGTLLDSVVTQTADGSVDMLDFSGSLSNRNLNVASSYLVAGTAGSNPIKAVNQDRKHDNVGRQVAGSTEGIQFVTQQTGGPATTLYVDSGYNDAANEGTLYASLQNALPLNVSIVDGGQTATSIYRAAPPVDLPAPTQTNITIQNDTTGAVDYLEYKGNTLVASAMHDYGTGRDFKIVVADYNSSTASNELVEQNSAGQLDFLSINASGNLTASDLTTQAFAPIVGSGYFGGTVAGQAHMTLMSQLSNGSLDALAFNSLGQLIGSDLVQGSAGLPHAVGIGESFDDYSLYAGGDADGSDTDTIVTQTADGTADLISLAGALNKANLSVSGSDALSSTAGSAPIGAVNQENEDHESLAGSTGTNNRTLEGIQFVSQLSDGHLNASYLDSGYGDAANEGTLYASSKTREAFSGWHVVDGQSVANGIFPVT